MVATQGLNVFCRTGHLEWSADSASEVSSVEAPPSMDAVRQRRLTTRRRSTRGGRDLDENEHLRRGRHGRRAHLRQCNENFLYRLMEVNEVEREDEDFQLGYNTRETPLASLLSDNTSMEEWYGASMHECYEETSAVSSAKGMEEERKDEEKENSRDRKDHPGAVTPEAAYSRISWRLRRGLLRRRQLPVEEMEEVESELRDFFTALSPGHWPRVLPPLSRLITHAVAEYLGLHSRSEAVPSELLVKKILVTNPTPKFSPPGVHLANYLAQHQH